jgi:hypothetical protein
MKMLHRKESIMAKAGSTFLDVDNPFPKLELQLLSDEILNLPEGFGDGYGIMLFYRGYW